jgi:glucosamine-6-phosphate deaminase
MKIEICEKKSETGKRAAALGADIIRTAIAERGQANVIMATGISQFDMLTELVAAPSIDWSKVTGFHLDEYAGISATHPASFRRYLKERFIDLLPQPIGAFHFIQGDSDLTSECRRLGEIISAHPIDLCFLGIGENGHIAFNDPPADFETNEPYMIVRLDDASRKQQLDQGWFATFDDVPLQAISMSVRQIMKSKRLLCTATGSRKAEAVKRAIRGPVTPDVPASILQEHPGVTLYLDPQSSALLQPLGSAA